MKKIKNEFNFKIKGNHNKMSDMMKFGLFNRETSIRWMNRAIGLKNGYSMSAIDLEEKRTPTKQNLRFVSFSI